MGRYRSVLALLLFVSLLLVGGNASQEKKSENTDTHDRQPALELIAHGEITLVAGRRGIFRTFKTSDGTEGSFVAGRFRSAEDAEQQVNNWRTVMTIGKSEEPKGGQSGHDAQLRLVGQAEETSGKKKHWVILVRQGMDCYLIQASSLPIALQIEKENTDGGE
jgi:hypothetical protein